MNITYFKFSGVFSVSWRAVLYQGMHMQHVQSDKPQNGCWKYWIYNISYWLHHIQLIQYWLVCGFQYSLWIHLPSKAHEDCLSLFVSCSQLQHRLLVKSDKIPLMKRENNFHPQAQISSNLLNTPMGTFNLKIIFTC